MAAFVMGCSRQNHGYMISGSELDTVIAGARNAFLTETNTHLVWKERERFTNHVIRFEQNKETMSLEIWITDQDPDEVESYRFQVIEYDRESEKFYVKPGLGMMHQTLQSRSQQMPDSIAGKSNATGIHGLSNGAVSEAIAE